MQTLLEVLQKSEAYLAKKGVARAKYDAEWLIAEALGYTRLGIYLHYERPLTEPELALLRERIRRRGNREPLQYILGHTPFAGLDLVTDSRALIPRPETEELVERLAVRFKETPPSRILDLGTGSGALALALAKTFPNAQVVGVDASAPALALAQENAQRNQLPQVQWLSSNWFAAVDGSFDLIVSNPPYLTEHEWQSAEPEVKNYEPRSALVADNAGLADLFTILETAPHYLTPNGCLALETGIAQEAALKEKIDSLATYTSPAFESDLSNRPRYLFAQHR